jgi:hypothetical protein
MLPFGVMAQFFGWNGMYRQGMNTHAPVVDGVAEQQGRQRDFALGQRARPGTHIG